jgi:hypothetical protein
VLSGTGSHDTPVKELGCEGKYKAGSQACIEVIFDGKTFSRRGNIANHISHMNLDNHW